MENNSNSQIIDQQSETDYSWFDHDTLILFSILYISMIAGSIAWCCLNYREKSQKSSSDELDESNHEVHNKDQNVTNCPQGMGCSRDYHFCGKDLPFVIGDEDDEEAPAASKTKELHAIKV